MAFVQGKAGTGSVGITSLAVTVTSNPTAGNLLSAGAAIPDTTGLAATETADGAWSVAINHVTTNAADDLGILYKANTVGGLGAKTVTVSWTNAANQAGVTIREDSGVLTVTPLDKTGAADATATTTVTSGSLTNTGSNGDLCIAVPSASVSTNQTWSNSTAGWAVDVNNSPNASYDAASASRYQTPAGAFTTTWTLSTSADLSVAVATFKLAPPAGGGLPVFNPGATWRRFYMPAAGHAFPGTTPNAANRDNPVSLTESVGPASDSVVRAWAGARAPTESVGPATDAVTRVFGGTRGPTESVGPASDAVTRAWAGERDLTESLGPASDSVARAWAGTRGPTESVGPATDAVSRALGAGRGPSESVGPASDSVTRAYAGSRAPSEAVGPASDSVARAWAGTRSPSETVGPASDAVSSQLGHPRSTAEAVGPASDAVTRAFAGTRTPTESVGPAADVAAGVKNAGAGVAGQDLVYLDGLTPWPHQTS